MKSVFHTRNPNPSPMGSWGLPREMHVGHVLSPGHLAIDPTGFRSGTAFAVGPGNDLFPVVC